ncbi:MAG: EamA family transporter, partial [Alphaproteobacteria bacterium]
MSASAMSPFYMVLAALATLAWGGNIPAIKLGLQEMSPFLFLSLRFLGLLILMLPWLRWRPGRMRDLLVVALLLGPLHFGVLFVGMDLIADASVVAVLSQLTVPFSTILGVTLLGERIGIWRTGGIVLAFLGVVVMMFEPRVFGDTPGVALVVFSAFAYALAAVRIRR